MVVVVVCMVVMVVWCVVVMMMTAVVVLDPHSEKHCLRGLVVEMQWLILFD